MKLLRKPFAVACLTALFTGVLSAVSVSPASAAEPMCNAAGFTGPYTVNPGGRIYTYWTGWAPRIAGGTFVKQDSVDPMAAYTVQLGTTVYAGGQNTNSYTLYGAKGWGNIIYLC